ncbi:PREDICTED: GRIP and coiled-coil domain-containing protein 1-like [Branchiostoma belcheri]|uniref:GRIP and coiled-coil domain-containing protein 1-like n=1 Tax=Branchiostoma belcheri TaxID=7741 RepID=A0A6P4ZWY8_BRABE|nr:PREDICTED: GRIP and coiled-coil domain-containing protein 1-like [Branchiostoma belcheri]
MDRAARRELIETIEQQKERIARLENRLRDVVTAYKGLAKEKEALEASIKVLTVQRTQHVERTAAGTDDSSETASEASGDATNTGDGGAESFVDPLNATGQAESTSANQDEILHLKEQLGTLTNALATVTDQKSQMEASFQADKKLIRQENENSKKLAEETQQRLEEQLAEAEEQLSQAKSRIRSQQQEREKEQTDHAMMLRELQKVLSDERASKEQLEQELFETKLKLEEKKATPDLSIEYEQKMQDLSTEMESLQCRLQAAETEAAKPAPLLLQLQEEMAEMRVHHRLQIQQEQTRANEAETRLKQLEAEREARVANLEAKLAELSVVVGNYDKIRQQDQEAMEKLKERIAQLDMENTALARVANNKVQSDDPDDSNLDVHALKEKILKLIGLMKIANERSDQPLPPEDLYTFMNPGGDDSDPGSPVSHDKCQQEYRQLKDEFERYKMRAQSVLKNKNAKDSSVGKEIETLRSQLQELREKHIALRQYCDEQELKDKQKVEDLEARIARIKNEHKKELDKAEEEYRQRAAKLETEMHKQRDRTIELLAEKEKEIQTLQLRSHSPVTPYMFSNQSEGSAHSASPRDGRSDAGVDDDDDIRSEHSDTVSELLVRPHFTPLMPSPGEGTIVHYAEQLARNEVELSAVRKQKHHLEASIHQLQEEIATKEEKYQDQIQALKREVDRLERNRSRESANLEYLKNVVLRYMTTSDYAAKDQMFKAIATILQFTSQERTKVTKFNTSWWYGSPRK